MDYRPVARAEQSDDLDINYRDTSERTASVGGFPTRAKLEDGKVASYRGQVATIVVVHLGLVLIHIALFIVWSHHYEHRIVVLWSTSEASRLPTVITAVSQLFGTVRQALAYVLDRG